MVVTYNGDRSGRIWDIYLIGIFTWVDLLDTIIRNSVASEEEETVP